MARDEPDFTYDFPFLPSQRDHLNNHLNSKALASKASLALSLSHMTTTNNNHNPSNDASADVRGSSPTLLTPPSPPPVPLPALSLSQSRLSPVGTPPDSDHYLSSGTTLSPTSASRAGARRRRRASSSLSDPSRDPFNTPHLYYTSDTSDLDEEDDEDELPEDFDDGMTGHRNRVPIINVPHGPHHHKVYSPSSTYPHFTPTSTSAYASAPQQHVSSHPHSHSPRRSSPLTRTHMPTQYTPPYLTTSYAPWHHQQQHTPPSASSSWEDADERGPVVRVTSSSVVDVDLAAATAATEDNDNGGGEEKKRRRSFDFIYTSSSPRRRRRSPSKDSEEKEKEKEKKERSSLDTPRASRTIAIGSTTTTTTTTTGKKHSRSRSPCSLIPPYSFYRHHNQAASVPHTPTYAYAYAVEDDDDDAEPDAEAEEGSEEVGEDDIFIGPAQRDDDAFEGSSGNGSDWRGRVRVRDRQISMVVPSCGDALRKEWQGLVLAVNFGVLNLSRRFRERRGTR